MRKLFINFGLTIAAGFTIATTAITATPAATAETCSSYCTPGVSKACGAGCISVDKLCRKSWTTACNKERPAKAKKHYENPKHLDTRPDVEPSASDSQNAE